MTDAPASADTAFPPRAANEPLALSVNQACELAGLGRSTLYRALRTGTLPARKHGRRTMILRRDLETFLANLPRV